MSPRLILPISARHPRLINSILYPVVPPHYRSRVDADPAKVLGRLPVERGHRDRRRLMLVDRLLHLVGCVESIVVTADVSLKIVPAERLDLDHRE